MKKILFLLIVFLGCSPEVDLQITTQSMDYENASAIRFLANGKPISDWLVIERPVPAVDTLLIEHHYSRKDTICLARPEYLTDTDTLGWTVKLLQSNAYRARWNHDFDYEDGSLMDVVRFEYGADAFNDRYKMMLWSAGKQAEPDTTFGWGLSWEASRSVYYDYQQWEGLLTGIPPGMYVVFSVRAVSSTGKKSDWHRSTWADNPYYLIYLE